MACAYCVRSDSISALSVQPAYPSLPRPSRLRLAMGDIRSRVFQLP
ncbi:Uncharacterised protein [Bordetella pertussis]|nr:Uncharacterised protein [Bordetella pertussis]CPM62935.1 Uncharacterised protein [Bordetella pertussis]